MFDLLFDTITLLRDYVWGGVAVVVAILILTLGFLAKTIHSSRTSDLARDELRLLKAFNEQAKENQGRDLSVGLQRIRPGTIGMRSSCSD